MGPWLGAVLQILALCFSPAGVGGETITSFSQWLGSPGSERQAAGPVRIDAVVLCHDPEWSQFFLHDGQRAIYLDPSIPGRTLSVGERARLTGVALGEDLAITNARIETLGRGALPRARRLKLEEMDQAVGQWVEVEGEARVVETSLGRLVLVLHHRGRRCVAFVMGAPPTGARNLFQDARIRVVGINGSRVVDGRLEARITVPGVDQMQVVAPAPPDARVEVITIGALLGRELGAWTNLPSAVQGVVRSWSEGNLVIEGPTGHIRAETIQSTPLRQGQRVELRGFLEVDHGEPVLRDASFEIAAAAAAPSSDSMRPDAETIRRSAGARTLTSVSEVLRTPRRELREAMPARLRGIVTYADAAWRNAFLQDGDAGIYVDLGDPDVRPGQMVEVAGHTSVGGYAPEIVEAKFRILGTTNLPPPARTDPSDLVNGHLDAHWVEMEGVVQRVRVEWGHGTLDLVAPKGRFQAILPNLSASDAAQLPRFVDAVVRVRGACSLQRNARGQLRGFMLHVPDLGSLDVLDAAPEDPFGVATTPIGSVGTFDPERVAGRRVKVSGVTTLVSGGELYIEDSTAGMRVVAKDRTTARIGDRVEALGFLSPGEFSPFLEEALVRVIQTNVPLPVARVSASGLLMDGSRDSARVKLEGWLVQDVARSAQPRLVLQDGPITFSARMLKTPEADELHHLRSGARVSVTGICVAQAGPDGRPRSFHLLAGGPADVVVLSGPPVWTARRILWAVGGMAAVLALTLSWAGMLRRTVRQRTLSLSEETERHKETAASLREEVARREQMEREVEKKHREMVELSRQAGMAEVATGMLHNVGNVLNSVNVSADLALSRARGMRLDGVTRAAGILAEGAADPTGFFKPGAKGALLQDYVARLGTQLEGDRGVLVNEIERLRKNIDHIKQIVAAQQALARRSEVAEEVQVGELVHDALWMVSDSMERRGIQLICSVDPSLPRVRTEKHKVIQILVNLLRNAANACGDCEGKPRTVAVRARRRDGMIQIQVEDNGHGIAPENLKRLFHHGFTTRRMGHGFGLHSAALAAKDLRGSLTGRSAGVGQGAEFTLEFPIDARRPDANNALEKGRAGEDRTGRVLAAVAEG